MKPVFLSITLSISVLLAAGCASNRSYKTVHINSNPPGAKVTIYDREGSVVATQETPAEPVLRPFQGYCSTERYKVVFEKPGYYPAETWLESTPVGWYAGDFGPSGPTACICLGENLETGEHWTKLPGELSRTLVPSTVRLSAEDLRILNKAEND